MSTEQLQLIAATFVPLLVSVLKHQNFNNTVNALIAVIVYVIMGLLSVIVSGQTFTIDNITPAITIFVAGGTVAYQLFWKNWGDPQITSKINGGTTPTVIPPSG